LGSPFSRTNFIERFNYEKIIYFAIQPDNTKPFMEIKSIKSIDETSSKKWPVMRANRKLNGAFPGDKFSINWLAKCLVQYNVFAELSAVMFHLTKRAARRSLSH